MSRAVAWDQGIGAHSQQTIAPLAKAKYPFDELCFFETLFIRREPDTLRQGLEPVFSCL